MDWGGVRQGDKEQEIATYPVETISFIRFNESEISKSLCLNWVISGENSQIFFNTDSNGCQENRQLANGMVEVAWYLPKDTDVKEDHFQDIQDVALFTNLRGNARNYPIQLKLIREISSKIVIFISTQELQQEVEIIRSFLESGKGVIIYPTDKVLGGQEKSLVKDFCKLLPKKHLKNIGFLETQDKKRQDITDEIRRYLRNLKTNELFKISLEEVAQSMLKLGMDVDEYEEVCQKGIVQAANILEIIQKYSNEDRKNKIIPLQGKLWSVWAENDKEFQRMKGFQQWKRKQPKGLKDDDETYKSELSKRMKRCREDQYARFKNSDSEAMQLFLRIMIEESTLVKEYFTRYLKLKLDELSRQEASKLRQSSKENRLQIEEIEERITEINPDGSEPSSEVKNLLEQQKRLAKEQDSLFTQISDQSLGLEHFLREMGQIYEAYKALGNHENDDKSEVNPSHLPKVAAELVLSGYPLEIMDGDVSSVPIVWIQAVFKELNQLLSESNEQKEPKILTLSTLGIQSSGKSTLLNTMFGLQFAVSAGRCTRGVYLQPVKVENELRKKLNTDYIFVVDTEGLSSFSHDYKHDNELSTFVIGLTSLSLIIIMKENTKYLEELLPISVLAFLRMEQQGLQRKCKLVHQNIDESARKTLITDVEKLQRLLNQKTQEACEIEKVPPRNFKSLIGFDVEEDVEYIPSLYEGDGAMVAVNPSYSEKINKLKKRIISKDNLPKSSINDFGKHLLDFWGAVKKDPFAYGFKDIIETQATDILQKNISLINWNFTRPITTVFVSDARTSIGNCQSIANLDQTFDKLKQELRGKVASSLITQESKLESFFENIENPNHKKYIMDREFSTFQELRDLSKELQTDAQQTIKEFYETQKSRLKSIDLKDNFRKKIYAKIKNFVEDKKKSRREGLSWSEEEQTALFEQIWTSIVKEIADSSTETLQPAKVPSDAWHILYYDIYESNRNTLNKLIKLSTDLINHDLPVSVKDSITSYSDKDNWWNKALEWMASRTKEDEKSTQDFFNKLDKDTQDFFNKLDKDIDKNLQTKIRNRVPYNKNDLTEILKDIEAKIAENNKNSNKRNTPKITKEIEISFAVSICRRYIKQLETIDKNFRSDNDTISNLLLDKPSYADIFVSLLDETRAKVKATTKLGEIIVEGIYQKIDENLVNSIRTKMQNSPNFNILAHKNVLLARIMISLAEEENFDNYMVYIHDFKKSLEYWLSKFFDEFVSNDAARIRDVINSEINLLVNSIKNIVNDIKDAPNIVAWTAKFHEKAESKININNLDQVNIMGSVIKDFDCVALKNDLTQRLDDAESILSNRLNDLFGEKREEKKKDFVSEISDKIIGCTDTCPFCGEICTYGKHSDSTRHEVLSHRPIGITGYRPVHGEQTLYGEQKKLITSTCQQLVNGDRTFRDKKTNGQDIPFKDYYKIYPEWTIIKESGGEDSTYWIWFMMKFSRKLADYYRCDDDKIEEPDIPDYWKAMNLTKEQEIEKLKKIIEGRA